jgi:hypothetical protein
VAEAELIWEISAFAGFVSENLQMKEEFRELRNHLGKSKLSFRSA